MNTPSAVGGCTSCGALYEPVSGDGELCPECRSLETETPSPAGGTIPFPMPRQPPGEPGRSPGAASAPRTRPRGGRGFRRIAIGAAGALLVLGLGAWRMSGGEHTPSEAWTAIRRHSFPEAWTAVRRHAAQAWIAIRHHASDAWIAVRRHTPFDDPQVEQGGPAAPATASSRIAVREATATQGTHRRAQSLGDARKVKNAAKRSKDD